MQTKPSTSEELVEKPDEGEVYRPDFVFLPKGRHMYRQEGPYLVCRTCELHHSVYVGMENIMIGENENGEPILRRRSELNLAS